MFAPFAYAFDGRVRAAFAGALPFTARLYAQALLDSDVLQSYPSPCKADLYEVLISLRSIRPMGCVAAYAILMYITREACELEYVRRCLCTDCIEAFDEEFVAYCESVVDGTLRPYIRKRSRS